MTNKLVAVIKSLKVPKIKRILLYEMKFLVPIYSCLQNPWLGGYRPPDPRSVCPLSSTELFGTPPRTKFLGTPLVWIRKDRRQKRHWVQPVVSKRLLRGQFYTLCEDWRNCRGKVFICFRMSIENFDKLLVIVGPRINYENTRLRLSVPPQERSAVTLR